LERLLQFDGILIFLLLWHPLHSDIQQIFSLLNSDPKHLVNGRIGKRIVLIVLIDCRFRHTDK